ncbi:MAG: biotin/lipoyl-containing protein [Planctomycetota bacterium]
MTNPAPTLLRELKMPDLGLGDHPMRLCMWLVKQGASVVAGDPVVEVLCDVLTVDLPAPCDGVLKQKLAAEGDTLESGRLLAVFEVG